MVLNVPLFLFGLKKLGLEFTVYSLFAVCVYSVGAWVITDVLPIDVDIASPWRGRICCCAPCSAALSPAWAAA